MVKASHSVEAMEACAAVGKASRPEVRVGSIRGNSVKIVLVLYTNV